MSGFRVRAFGAPRNDDGESPTPSTPDPIAFGRSPAHLMREQRGSGDGPADRAQARKSMTMLDNVGGAAAAAPEGLIKETTTQSFMKDVIEESKRQPVLIDFWAPWCGPCKQLTPILEKVVKGAKGKVKLVKMNIDEHPAIPGRWAFSRSRP